MPLEWVLGRDSDILTVFLISQFSGGGQLGLDGLCLGYPSFDHSRIMDKHRICYSWNRLPSAVRYGKPRAGLEPAKNSSNLTKIFP